MQKALSQFPRSAIGAGPPMRLRNAPTSASNPNDADDSNDANNSSGHGSGGVGRGGQVSFTF